MDDAQQQALAHTLSHLNPQQRGAACHDSGPLLIVAGAGTGKTATLVHRVAYLIATGAEPERVLLLTFTRRAAEEMLRRSGGVLRRLADAWGPEHGARLHATRVWGGTFHAIASRLLRRYGKAIGLPDAFTILDRSDAEDLMAVVRTELGLAKTDRRFPQKSTCMDIYSRSVNAQEKLPLVLATAFPWCLEWGDALGRLFDAYVDRKAASATLDYDDLLLYWHALLADSSAGDLVRSQFDHVLVDEYQDTNVLQAEILYHLRRDGTGLTVVGDDAQSIYSFRAATVRNILDFPKRYPQTTVVTLEQNYRSTQPILEATNHVIGLAAERFTKNLWTERRAGEQPWLVTCDDEDQQADFVIRTVLAHREAGIALRRQAVLFRTSHHSMLLEAELARRNVPFHKYGGLKFVEAAHVKDLLGFLRLVDNPLDLVAGTRILPLLPGIGPAKARHLMQTLAVAEGRFSAWHEWKPPDAAALLWPQLVEMLDTLARSHIDPAGQVERVRQFYEPLLQEHYDNPQPRARDLEQLALIAGRYKNRRQMLLEMALDPPHSSQDLAGKPLLDEDYLVLSTIHSAKGLEWDVVHVIHAADGNIPSDMSTGSPEQIEEERRLFYVALTRAKSALYVCHPARYYHARYGLSDRHSFAQRTRFIPGPLVKYFHACTAESARDDVEPADVRGENLAPSVRRRTKRLWGPDDDSDAR
jgi:DNA helicase-2/ATP-dependent DNA helicase PcrA